MENENNIEENRKESTLKKDIKGIAKFLGILVAIFLGVFCAFYVIIDWHIKQMFMPFSPSITTINRTYDKEMRTFDKEFIKAEKLINNQNNNIIHMTKDSDEYKIVIDLKKFDNNEKNIQIKAIGNMLTISGRSVKKNSHNEEISEFQQSYQFEKNVKLENLTKNKVGNSYVITIPVENN